MIPKNSKVLTLKEPWMTMILSGEKTMELRSTRTNIRGTIYLAQSKTQYIFGKVDIVDCLGPFSDEVFELNKQYHRYHKVKPYNNTYGWVLSNAFSFCDPILFKRPPGAVIWSTVKEDINC